MHSKKLRILTCTYYYYYGYNQGIEPQYYYLSKVPEKMGHEVDFFDYETACKISVEQMRRLFLSLVKGGDYDVVFIATTKDQFDESTITEAKKYCPVIAWNSDDEWRWEDYSKKMVNWYSFMVSNDPDVYEANKAQYVNLLHAQWACTGFWNGLKTPKDIPFSFVGQVYGKRQKQTATLKKQGLVTYGMGSGNLSDPEKQLSGLAKMKNDLTNAFLKKFRPVLANEMTILNFDHVNKLWNRSQVSFTPLDSSSGNAAQIKSRVFDMGLSGTVMLAHQSDKLNTYYEPDMEYVPFNSLEECADKAAYYIKHPEACREIAGAYANRTRAEHLWEHRIQRILVGAGLI